MIDFLKNLPEMVSAFIIVITTIAAIVTTVAQVIKTIRDGGKVDIEKTMEAAESVRGKLKALRNSGALNTLEEGITEGLKLIEEHRGKPLSSKMVRKAKNRLETILRDEGVE